jgi:hypothetical protein
LVLVSGFSTPLPLRGTSLQGIIQSAIVFGFDTPLPLRGISPEAIDLN